MKKSHVSIWIFLHIILIHGRANPPKPSTHEELQILLNLLPTYKNDDACLKSERCADNWMIFVNMLYQKLYERGAYLGYQHDTNVTEENAKLLEEFSELSFEFSKRIFVTGKQFYVNSQNWNESLRRLLYVTRIQDVYDPQVTTLTNELIKVYATAKVCEPSNTSECYPLEPGLHSIMAKSRDSNQLLWAYQSWINATGPKMKNLYAKRVEMQNKVVQSLGFSNLFEQWILELETDEFERVCDELFNDLKPLYTKLHSYVLKKLKKFYDETVIKPDAKLIPAHLLGNMWAQTWDNIFDLVVPYPKVKVTNLTESLLNLNYTVRDIFSTAENFFQSIGLFNMTSLFWAKSMLERPLDREVVCHASAHDFSNNVDYRIKMCTEINADSFYVVHHEMGHIEYFMSYAEQLPLFRAGANSAFHEAIGDTIALSIFNKNHFSLLNLTNTPNETYEESINFLMKMALQKIAFMPFGYLIDKYRWSIFRGEIKEDKYNEEWWRMRREYQGIDSPVQFDPLGFDAGAKYHVPANVPYVRYFMANFLQFEFYKSLCILADYHGPLHQCDFYGSIKAGAKLKEMMSLGNSKHWSDALQVLTGKRQVTSKALLEYFKPLNEWLDRQF